MFSVGDTVKTFKATGSLCDRLVMISYMVAASKEKERKKALLRKRDPFGNRFPMYTAWPD